MIILQCSICGADVERVKKLKYTSCFNCKREIQKGLDAVAKKKRESKIGDR